MFPQDTASFILNSVFDKMLMKREECLYLILWFDGNWIHEVISQNINLIKPGNGSRMGL